MVIFSACVPAYVWETFRLILQKFVLMKKGFVENHVDIITKSNKKVYILVNSNIVFPAE